MAACPGHWRWSDRASLPLRPLQWAVASRIRCARSYLDSRRAAEARLNPSERNSL